MGVLDFPAFAGFGYPASLDPALLRNSDTAACGINIAMFYRCRDGGTISKIALEVTTAATNVCVGVYANSGIGTAAVPTTRKATSGSVTCPTAGYAEISLGSTVTVQPGDWLAIATDGATSAFRSGLFAELVSVLAAGRSMKRPASFPLPSDATGGSIAGTAGRAIVLVGVA